MSQFYSVSLPVKPHVKKFVQSLEGNTIYWKGTSPLCMILRAFLVNKTPIGYSSSRLHNAVSCRRSIITMYVPISKMGTVGTYISPDNVILINRLLEDWFEKTFLSFVQVQVKKDGRYRGYKDAIESFVALYNIDVEEDISMDGLIKMEQRSRKKVSKNISTPVHSLFGPQLAQVS